MNIVTSLIIFAILAAAWGIVAGIMIFKNLRRRGEQVSFLGLRLMFPVYLHRYSKLTRAEQGQTGSLFYHYIIAFNLVLIAVVAMIALLFIGGQTL